MCGRCNGGLFPCRLYRPFMGNDAVLLFLHLYNSTFMSIQERMQSTTPPFFAKVRNWGLILAAASAAILTTPVALPAIIVKVAGYMAVAGTVAGAVSQAVTEVNQEG